MTRREWNEGEKKIRKRKETDEQKGIEKTENKQGKNIRQIEERNEKIWPEKNEMERDEESKREKMRNWGKKRE